MASNAPESSSSSGATLLRCNIVVLKHYAVQICYILAVNSGILADTGGTCSDADCTVSGSTQQPGITACYTTAALLARPTRVVCTVHQPCQQHTSLCCASQHALAAGSLSNPILLHYTRSLGVQFSTTKWARPAAQHHASQLQASVNSGAVLPAVPCRVPGLGSQAAGLMTQVGWLHQRHMHTVPRCIACARSLQCHLPGADVLHTTAIRMLQCLFKATPACLFINA
jgi:hypothetical protein